MPLPAYLTRWDPGADELRRVTANRLRVIYEWRWSRNDQRGDELREAAGSLVEDQIEARFSGGPRQMAEDATNARVPVGRQVRWRLLGATADLGVNYLGDLATAGALLTPPVVGGDIVSPAWEWLWERCDYGRAFLARESGVIGLQSMSMRPVLEEYRPGEYYPAGMVEVPPDLCFALPDPAAPGTPAVYGCAMEDGDPLVYGASGRRTSAGGWYVWDMSEPTLPVWGRWASPEAWYRWRLHRPDAARVLAAMMAGRPDMMGQDAPSFIMAGPAYPWRWGGAPIMPATCQQREARERSLLPCQPGEGQAVLDIVLQRLWIEYMQHQSGVGRTFILSPGPIDVMGNILMEPNALNSIWGSDGIQLIQTDANMEPIKIARALHRERVEEWARRYNPDFEAQTTEAQSGIALRIRSSGRHRLRTQQTERARVVDTRAIRALVSTHNALVWSGQLSSAYGSPGLIPEGAITLRYPLTLDSIEAEQRRALVVAEVDAGREYAERLRLMDAGMDVADPGDPAFIAAGEYIDGALASAARRAAMGMGLRPQDRYMMATATVADEAQTHIPPSEVADTAARGLRLRDETGRGLDRMRTYGRGLYARAERLRGQDPMLLGDVRSLRDWLTQHADDGNIPTEVGQWGNDADPSAAWVEFLSQGGDPGLTWCSVVLAEGQTSTVAPIAPEPPPTGDQ